jgi:hypothetical protein
MQYFHVRSIKYGKDFTDFKSMAKENPAPVSVKSMFLKKSKRIHASRGFNECDLTPIIHQFGIF